MNVRFGPWPPKDLSEWCAPKPTFLPLMKRPCAPVEKNHADYMRSLLERTCAELRLPNG